MTTVDTAIKATLTAEALRKILRQVEPHMNENDYHPGISGIRLEGTGRELIAIATDRYTMGIARTKLRSDDGPWDAIIPGGRVKSLRQWLKAHAYSDNIHIRPADTSITFASSSSELTMSTADGEFPKWRNMMRTLLAAEPEPVPLTAFTTAFLARWGAAGIYLSVSQASPTKPLILFGDDFLGLHMPAKQADGFTRDKALQEWADTLAEPVSTPPSHEEPAPVDA